MLWPCRSGELAAEASAGRAGFVGVLPVVLNGDRYGLLSDHVKQSCWLLRDAVGLGQVLGCTVSAASMHVCRIHHCRGLMPARGEPGIKLDEHSASPKSSNRG